MLTKVIDQAKIDHAIKWFERADKIVIVSHVSPDGDAIGSSLGLYHFLDSQEKTVNVIVPNAFPDFLKWMPGSKDILLYDRYKDFADKLIAEADVICCLDFNALKRIDDMADAVAASPARKMMIDHHLYPEEFCGITMSYPKISSTSELIFRLICRMGYFSDISKEGAECIYTGMNPVLSFSVISLILITRHGLPTATTPEGMLRVTTLPAPMTVSLPMLTPGNRMQLPPIQTRLPTWMLFGMSAPAARSSASR